MPRQVAKHIEVLAIYDELKEVLKQIGEGRCEYKEGHDDETVAKKVNVSVTSVASIRRARFGKLNETNLENRFKQQTGDLVGRMAELHSEVHRALASLQARHEALQHKHDLLCTQLSANRIADVKHLRMTDPHAGLSNGTRR